MLTSNLNQALNFLCTAGLGFIIGMLYDLFSVILTKIKAGKIVTGAFDVLFWIISTAATFFLFFCFHNSGVEWYLFLGIFLGLILYFFSFGNIFRKIFLKIIEFTLKLFKILLTPLRFLLKMMNKVIQFLIKIFMEPVGFLLDHLKKWTYAVVRKFRRLDFRQVHRTAILPQTHHNLSKAAQMEKEKK
jgi:spore cortex biosynthesis protein YabQ